MRSRPPLLPLLACVLLLALLSCSPAAPPAEAHVFSALPFEKALAQADAERKLLLVDATATWCPPCRQMEETTWRDARVAAWVAQHAIAVQVDVDRDQAVAQILGVEQLPTLVVFQHGRERDRRIGYHDADALLAWLEAGVAAR